MLFALLCHGFFSPLLAFLLALRDRLTGLSLHIERSGTTVGDSAADGTGKGETRIESEAAELLRFVGLNVLLEGVKLDGAGRRWRCSRHCDGSDESGELRGAERD